MRLHAVHRGWTWRSSRHVAGRFLLAAGAALACWLSGTVAQGGAASPNSDSPQPLSWSHDVQPLANVARIEAPTVDRQAVQLEDQERDQMGLPPRYAIPNEVFLTPDRHGTWDLVDARTALWRLRISSAGAVSLNLGFTRYFLPPGGSLSLYRADRTGDVRTFTDADNAAHGELWTPVVLGDDIVVELAVPLKARDEVQLELTSINVGYRGFGELLEEKSGACNIDVVCPEGDPWRDEIQSVGVISTGGSTFCTGFMVNNTAQDQTPYFMTANHCGINTGNAASLVVYWNFESPNCGDHCCGTLNEYQTGSYWRASYSTSDFTLVELDELPDSRWNVSYAGWDNTSADPTSATTIHHPNTDEKSISFEFDPTFTTSYLGTSTPGNGSHIRIVDWDVGTTEPGSSGSPLFDQNHHVVGQLHGGYAACGNDLSDWYGRFSMSWTGGGSSTNRLSNWLDPLNSGVETLDLLAPYATGLRVTPSSGLEASGDPGGPFAPESTVYTLENQGDQSLDFDVSADQTWVTISGGSGMLDPGATTDVTVSLNSGANGLGVGLHQATVSFTNSSTHDGDTTRPVTLQVGTPQSAYAFTLDSNPGWTGQDQWAYGVPTGQGGQHGGPDPTSGHTGSNVFGYNLNGDYPNNMPERHLTTGAIDCSHLSAVSLHYWRWLGVETPTYDHASIRVSNDGTNWTTVWQNTGYVEDGSWVYQEIDISDVADQQPTVYLRWTMGSTDGSWQYCGWNIDDVEIWGLQEGATGVADDVQPVRTALLPNSPNPFNPMTEIRFDLAQAGQVSLAVYDLRGRLVRHLESGTLPAGRHSAVWDGRDDSGRAVGSGTYLCRLVAQGLAEDRKMLLVR